MEKLEIRAVIKYFYKKEIPTKEIHKDFMETLGKESPSYSTVKTWAAEFKSGRESIGMMGGLAAPKMSLLKTLVLKKRSYYGMALSVHPSVNNLQDIFMLF